jgi:hypothetical protein
MSRFYQYNNAVPPRLDLSLLPIYRIKGEKWPQFPGLFSMLPPRRTARGREDDRLIIYLTFSGNAPFTTSEYSQIATQMAGNFYQASGSVTAAIRATAEAFNQSLVDRNLRTTGKGEYIIGRLILGVLHGTQFVCAQCGPTHAFHFTGREVQHFHDPQISGRGLGIGQATPLFLSQVELQHGDLMVLCADMPAGWESALMAKQLVTPEALNRELFSITTDDLNGILVHVQAGKGAVTILKSLPPSWGAAGQTARVQARIDRPSTPVQTQVERPSPLTSEVQSQRPASRFARLLAGVETEKPTSPPSPTDQVQEKEITPTPSAPAGESFTPPPAQRPTPPAVKKTAQPFTRAGRFVASPTTGELPEIQRPAASSRGIFRLLARMFKGTRLGMQGAADRIRRFLPNLLPGTRSEAESSGPSMAILAIAIPIIVVTIAGLVYTRYGRASQFQDYFNKALEQASQAHGQTNPADVRHAWESTLYFLEQADNYQITQESLNLRQEAQTALDNLDGITRLDFRPAITGSLDRTVQVTRMAASGSDLYLLDGSRGSVIRASLGSQMYEVDPNFQCGPGQLGTVTVGPLVDIEALQMSNDYNARIIAIDRGGNLLYCGFNMQPVVVTLSPPPLGWQGISGFSLDPDGRNLYVLDPAGNTIWVFRGVSGKFIDSPTIFFGEQVPHGMGNAVDVAANNSELFLLFTDGHAVVCPVTRFDVTPMRCQDPATYVDNRPERTSGPHITDAIFSQMTFAPAPDPSLYMLEPLTRAVYYFSARPDLLELRGQLRSTEEQSRTLFDGPATAATISPSRTLLLAVGSQVFFAANMP